jgi:hypothetical protein
MHTPERTLNKRRKMNPRKKSVSCTRTAVKVEDRFAEGIARMPVVRLLIAKTTGIGRLQADESFHYKSLMIDMVHRLTREDSLPTVRHRKFFATTDSIHCHRLWPNVASTWN